MSRKAFRLVRGVLLGVTALLLAYLVVLALRPSARPPGWLSWFGKPGQWGGVAVVVGLVALVSILTYRGRANRQSSTVPFVIIGGLTATSFVLAFSSYWSCNDDKHPTFFTPLAWTLALLKGGIEERSLGGGVCPGRPPVALEVARLGILAAILLAGLGVVGTLFRMQSDRLRVYLARSVTAVVGLDEDSAPMIAAIATTLDGTSLVLMTAHLDRPCVRQAAVQGARVLSIDPNGDGRFGSPRFWRKVKRLYLLSPDTSTNLARLKAITAQMEGIDDRRRLPLVVRIDDPWIASAWRAEQFGGSDVRWVADATGKHEATARRLLDDVAAQHTARQSIICGTSQLTMALLADLAQREMEHAYHALEGRAELPAVVLMAENAAEYHRDHLIHQRRAGLPPERAPTTVIAQAATMDALAAVIGDDSATTAVIFVEAPLSDPMIVTRLAARYPRTSIYAWDNRAEPSGERLAVVGRLRNYRLAIDVRAGQAQDDFERAAMLIHERYSSGGLRNTPASRPWAQLGTFYQGSNRRQVYNAFWMVEQIAGHTWNTWGQDLKPVAPLSDQELQPLERLRLLGFDADESEAMARAEHEDWCRYYLRHGWRYGPTRDDTRKTHPRLISWEQTKANDKELVVPLNSLATTMGALWDLGYRSTPKWKRYRRAGVVTAKRRWRPWTWTSRSGDIMQAGRGDWQVSDGSGSTWSARNSIFRASYEHVHGDQWKRAGTVLARPAEPGETVQSMEGAILAPEGGWILQGTRGEQWPVTAEFFSRNYTEQVSPKDYCDEFLKAAPRSGSDCPRRARASGCPRGCPPAG